MQGRTAGSKARGTNCEAQEHTVKNMPRVTFVIAGACGLLLAAGGTAGAENKSDNDVQHVGGGGTQRL
ncbi:hypothetical protein San01_71940 [Streptomyces angustmyceticus]|uniref:Uncharacterized protein n=1 Tax=Streptomyces angustmyceticus TaxID=285578 RepID=A0A5J4LT61_9ACTN|nr:hypothetical protein San01_71940 [Streptomyces angustmyceticus]